MPPGAFVVSVMLCQIEVSATSWSLVQRSPTDCGASLCVINKPREWGGYDSHWVAAPQSPPPQKKINFAHNHFVSRSIWLIIHW